MSLKDLQEKAAAGDLLACAPLSLRYALGDGVEHDRLAVFKLKEKVGKNVAVIEQVFTREAVGESKDAARTAHAFWREIDLTKANEFKLLAAELGDAYMQVQVGSMIMTRAPRQPEYDPYDAERWFLKALAQGYDGVHRYLYKLYSEKQFGNIYNPDKAFYHVQFVSDLGGHDATAALASFYANGMGTDVDKVQAVKWAFIATCQFQRGEVLDLIKSLYACRNRKIRFV